MKNLLVKPLLDKAILTMTGSEFLELLKQAKVTETKEEREQTSRGSYPELPKIVTGIKSLAKVLGISVSTVNRMKAEGVLDDAIFQNGKTVIFDTYKVLEILRVSNKKNFNLK